MRWGLIDQIDDITVGKSARGRRTWDPALPLFLDHFPDFPVVPGVLTLEALAQLSGKLIGYTVRKERGDWPFPILSMVNGAKFRKFVRPGEVVELESRFVDLREESAMMSVRARIGGRVHAQAEEFFVFNAVPLADAAEADRLEKLERSELARLWEGYPGD